MKNQSKNRFPTLCAWCENGVSSEKKTMCSANGFKEKQEEDKWPSILECESFIPESGITPVIIDAWAYGYVSHEIDRLQVKKLVMERMQEQQNTIILRRPEPATEIEKFHRALEYYTEDSGWFNWYFIVATSTYEKFRGTWMYAAHGTRPGFGFYDFEVEVIKSGLSQEEKYNSCGLVELGKAVDEEQLYHYIEEGYVSLHLKPKSYQKAQLFPEQCIYPV